MAQQRLIQLYRKGPNDTFLGPIKIGSSAEYVTVSQDSTKTLKDLSEQIGNPDYLQPNVGLPQANQQDIVTFLNSVSAIANNAFETANRDFSDGSIDQKKLKSITLTDTSLQYPTIGNDTIGVTLGKIKKFLLDLKNKKLDIAGGSMTGDLTITNTSDIIIDDDDFITTLSTYISL